MFEEAFVVRNKCQERIEGVGREIESSSNVFDTVFSGVLRLPRKQAHPRSYSFFTRTSYHSWLHSAEHPASYSLDHDTTQHSSSDPNLVPQALTKIFVLSSSTHALVWGDVETAVRHK